MLTSSGPSPDSAVRSVLLGGFRPGAAPSLAETAWPRGYGATGCGATGLWGDNPHAARLAPEELEQLTDRGLALADSCQGPVDIHPVPVAAPDALELDVAGGLEVRQDLAHGAFGDPDGLGDREPGAVRVGVDVGQHQGMIGQEAPRCHDDRTPATRRAVPETGAASLRQPTVDQYSMNMSSCIETHVSGPGQAASCL